MGDGVGIKYLPKSIHCEDAIGYLAVYRICFVVTMFFLFMSVIMIGVRNSRDPRAGLQVGFRIQIKLIFLLLPQNGFWGLKYLIIIAGCIGAFFIPHGNFGPTWMYFGMVGGFLFIIIQLVLIIDFAHSWAESWQENHAQVLELMFTIFLCSSYDLTPITIPNPVLSTYSVSTTKSTTTAIPTPSSTSTPTPRAPTSTGSTPCWVPLGSSMLVLSLVSLSATGIAPITTLDLNKGRILMFKGISKVKLL